MNRLKINIDKTKVMLIGSKAQIKSLDVDDFISSYDDTPLELVENAKYLGMFINCDIYWDFQVRRLCQTTYYHISLLRWLRRIFPKNLLLQVYKITFKVVMITVSLCMTVARKKCWLGYGEFWIYKLSQDWPC